MIVKNRAYGIIKNKKASYCFISEQVPKDKRKHYFAHAKEFKAGQFKALEAGQVLVQCFDPTAKRCTLLPGCRLRAELAGAEAAFLAHLDHSTLADIAWPAAPS